MDVVSPDPGEACLHHANWSFKHQFSSSIYQRVQPVARRTARAAIAANGRRHDQAGWPELRIAQWMNVWRRWRPTRRRPAGWQPRWRRSAPDGVRSGTAQNAAMFATVACRKFLVRRRSARWQHDFFDEMCRGRGEKSNVSIVGPRKAAVLLLQAGQRQSKSSHRISA